MAFEKELPEWKAKGVKPPQSKLDEGWKVQDKPPAAWLNWQMNSTYEALKELQEKIVNSEALNKHVLDANRHVTAEKQFTWDAKETTEGAQKKADKALSGAKVYTDEKAATAEINAKNASWSKGIYVPGGTDLNNLINEGDYYSPSNFDVGTMLNCPLPLAFNLKVNRHAGINQLFTTYAPEQHNFRIFTRNFYTTWSPWYEVWTSANRPSIRNIHYSTSDPSGGSEGDVWIKI